jgi:menaquinone-dependent protoporphyrinogen oxidase
MRVLVTAASRHNATTEVAQAIADTLERAGIKVEVRRPEEIGHLAGYDAVVLGSAVYAGHWLKPAKDLIERTSSRLRILPVWLFSTGPIGEPLKPDSLPADVGSMLEQSGAREHRLFGGRVDRSWDEIQAWADQIAATIKPGPRILQPTESGRRSGAHLNRPP